MNVLIIDASKRSAQIMRRFLAKGIEDVGVTEYDAEQNGEPPHAFDWSSYDVVIFGEDYGPAGTGLEWFEKFRSSANFPGAVLIVTKADPQITAKALKLGAYDVLVKRELSSEALCGVVRETRVVCPRPATGKTTRPSSRGRATNRAVARVTNSNG
jgi:DNA-binding response OmpR family regulator